MFLFYTVFVIIIIKISIIRKGGAAMEFDENFAERKKRINDFINSKDYVPLKRGEMRVVLQVPKEDKDVFDSVIDSLIEDGAAVETKKGKVVSAKAANLNVGTFMANVKGFGFVRLDDGGDDIFIPSESTLNAMNRDRVLVRIVQSAYGDMRARGEVVKILSKEKKGIVGTFDEGRGFGFVICDDQKIDDIFIPKGYTKGAVTGSKVVVNITKRPVQNKSAEGEIVEILGHKDDPGVDILSIIRQFELPVDYPQEVYDQTEKMPEDITDAEIEGREDFRNILTVTIDGDDSKDFDDAVSLDMLENGNFLLGVHIADVSHYVTEGSPLDKEAYLRGTSVYLVDRVIPMIPHRLSNGICSLNPGVDRLTLSCVMEIDHSGTVVNHKIVESVIHSDCRMTYTKVNNVIEKNDKAQIEEYKDFVPMLRDMDTLRGILNHKRKQRGSVNFDFPESQIKLTPDGKVIDIKPYDKNSATNLIEEFMLVCNETIAEDYYWQGVPFMFRNHEQPDSEKIEALRKILYQFGYRIKGRGEVHPREIQRLIEKISGTPYENIISRIVLRSMKQAKYQAENLGHFGLAAKYYCHFTSPIRRYPDLQIHRIIKENISGGITEERAKRYNSFMEEAAYHCSTTERRADDAERETDRLKMAEYMSERIGNVYDGIISGVTGWGIYVELPNTVEGMVPLNEIEDDFYEYEEENMRAVGRHTGKIYRLGDSVKVKVIRTDIQARTIDFMFTDDEGGNENGN